MPITMPQVQPDLTGQMPVGIDPSQMMPAASPATGMTPEQMKTDLDQKLKAVENKAKSFETKKAISKQAIMDTKRKILGSLFDMLKRNGVDPNNLESINAFMTKLEEQDPDMAQLFEEVFNSIGSMDSQTTYPPAPVPQESQLMDKFQNLGAEMMMPRENATPVDQTGQPPEVPNTIPAL